jgi:hypothetical protein
MNPENWRRIASVLDAVLTREPSDWNAGAR